MGKGGVLLFPEYSAPQRIPHTTPPPSAQPSGVFSAYPKHPPPVDTPRLSSRLLDLIHQRRQGRCDLRFALRDR